MLIVKTADISCTIHFKFSKSISTNTNLNYQKCFVKVKVNYTKKKKSLHISIFKTTKKKKFYVYHIFKYCLLIYKPESGYT